MARPNQTHKIDLMMLLKGFGLVVTLVLTILSGAGAYYSILGRLDRVDERMAAQAEQLKTLAESIKTLATEALSPADLMAFCLQAQIANRNWTCPLTASDAKTTPTRPLRRAVQLNKATVP